MKKKTIIMITIFVLLLAMIPIGLLLKPDQKSEPKQNDIPVNTKTLSEEKQEEFLTKLTEMKEVGYRPTEMEAEIKKNISQLDKEHSTKAIRELMTVIDESRFYFQGLLYFMGNELAYSQVVDKVDNPVQEADKITNEFAKGFIKEVQRQHVNVTMGNSYYYFEPDAAYILEQYGDYIHGDYKELINLMAKQQTDPIYDSEKEIYKLERIREDLVYLENGKERWMDGEYAEDFQSIEKELYEILFGTSHMTFYDITKENEGTDQEEWTYTLKKDVREQYEDIISKYGDMSFAKELQEFLGLLKKNDYILNEDIKSFIEDLMEKKFGKTTESKDESPKTEETVESEK